MSEFTKKTHYSVAELLSLNLTGLPTSHKNLLNKAKKENWQSRPRQGKGGGVEYALTSLPPEAQRQLKYRLAQQHAQASVPAPEAASHERYLSATLWQPFDQANTTQKAKAEQKYHAVRAVAALVAENTPLMEAIALVSQAQRVPCGSLKNWYYKVKAFDPSDWLAVLLKRTGKTPKTKAHIDETAWQAFLSDYLRPEAPALSACYERLKRAAHAQGWAIPSQQTLARKLAREIPYEVIVLKRQGERKLIDLVPALTRTVADLQALEWLNGDGYQHNVFVQWHNGEIVRPKTWLWQDVRTRKIVGYRTDISENTDSIRLSLMDVIYTYGIPRHITIDNTRAAANKWLTGGVANRYRFKVKADDPKGLIPLLGIELHWTSVIAGKGHGQAKPIERAFSHGGLGELVDKDPLLAGFYAGSNVYTKPDNYNGGKQGANYQDFITALERGIDTFNQKTHRKTELCQGIYSFDQVFERDYAKATVRKATHEQLRMLLLTSEKVRIKANGEFSLNAGGQLHQQKNRYWAESLIGTKHKDVVVRFDPAKLHEQVYVYSLDGIFLAEATCQHAAAFGNTQAARTQNRLRTRIQKTTKQLAKDLALKEAHELSHYQPQHTPAAALKPDMIELFVTHNNTVRKVLAPQDTQAEEAAEHAFEAHFFNGVNQLKLLKK